MNKKETLETIKRYNLRFKKYGISNKTLGWGNKDRSDLRFEIFNQLFEFQNLSILDFGCGFGSFYGFLKHLKIIPKSYLGIDINQNFIDTAKEKYPDVEFKCIDIIDDSFISNYYGKFDVAVSSGVFNFKIENYYKYVESCFNILHNVTRKGFTCNFLSSKTDEGYLLNKQLQYSVPEKILSTAYKFSNNLVLRNDYMPFEFTIKLEKVEIDKNLTVYKNYLKYVNKV